MLKTGAMCSESIKSTLWVSELPSERRRSLCQSTSTRKIDW